MKMKENSDNKDRKNNGKNTINEEEPNIKNDENDRNQTVREHKFDLDLFGSDDSRSKEDAPELDVPKDKVQQEQTQTEKKTSKKFPSPKPLIITNPSKLVPPKRNSESTDDEVVTPLPMDLSSQKDQNDEDDNENRETVNKILRSDTIERRDTMEKSREKEIEDDPYQELRAFLESCKCETYFDALIENDIKHPSQLVDTPAPKRGNLAKTLGLKGFARVRFMKAIQKYTKQPPASRLSDTIAKLGKRFSLTKQSQNIPVINELTATKNNDLIPISDIINDPESVSLSNKHVHSKSRSRVFSVPAPLQYIGTAQEKRLTELLQQRYEKVESTENDIRTALQQLESSISVTQSDIGAKYDEVINKLQEAKKNALEETQKLSVGQRSQLLELVEKISKVKDQIKLAESDGDRMLHVIDKSDAAVAKANYANYVQKTLKSTILDVSIPSIRFDIRYGSHALEVPHIYVEGNVVSSTMALSPIDSPNELLRKRNSNSNSNSNNNNNSNRVRSNSNEMLYPPPSTKWQPLTNNQFLNTLSLSPNVSNTSDNNGDYVSPFEWKQDFEHNGNACKFRTKNTVYCNGQGLFVANINITKAEKIFWEIKILQAPELFWIGFLEGPLEEIQWESGEYPPVSGYGLESEYGYWYNGTRYSGLGVGRVMRRRDKIYFELDIEKSICKGDLNDPNCRRVFYQGPLPEQCCIGVLNFTGVGEFEIHGRRPNEPFKW